MVSIIHIFKGLVEVLVAKGDGIGVRNTLELYFDTSGLINLLVSPALMAGLGMTPRSI